MRKLEGRSLSVAEAAETEMKQPSRTTDVECGGKVYIGSIIVVTQASTKI